tara:strand:- start:280 stop:504 length:225 start_codon:yes stop_codon:yes gene_type:complete
LLHLSALLDTRQHLQPYAPTPAVAACIQAVTTCSQAPGGGKLAADQAEFVEAARAKGRKLMVMTFSSMPVPPQL